MAQPRICIVSFTDPEGISHSVEVPAATLYEAAVFAVAEFRKAGLFEVHIGPGSRLRVAVKPPRAVHERKFGNCRRSKEVSRRAWAVSLVPTTRQSGLDEKCLSTIAACEEFPQSRACLR